MTKYVQLCADLLTRLEGLYAEIVEEGVGYIPEEAQTLMTRAWEAMAQNDPEEPMDKKLPNQQQIDDLLSAIHDAYSSYGWVSDEDLSACLIRWPDWLELLKRVGMLPSNPKSPSLKPVPSWPAGDAQHIRHKPKHNVLFH